MRLSVRARVALYAYKLQTGESIESTVEAAVLEYLKARNVVFAETIGG